jgi:hypothetical protein
MLEQEVDEHLIAIAPYRRVQQICVLVREGRIDEATSSWRGMVELRGRGRRPVRTSLRSEVGTPWELPLSLETEADSLVPLIS